MFVERRYLAEAEFTMNAPLAATSAFAAYARRRPRKAITLWSRAHSPFLVGLVLSVFNEQASKARISSAAILDAAGLGSCETHSSNAVGVFEDAGKP